MGNELTWECDPSNPCMINFTYKAWEDCPRVGGSDYPDLQWICNNGSGGHPALTTNWGSVSFSQIAHICPGAQTLCSPGGAGTAHDASQVIYQGGFNKCNTSIGTLCSDLTILWAYSHWSANITSLVNPETQFAAGSSRMTPELLTCNSSPQFAIPPMVEICNDQTSVFSVAAVDPDGDRIRYSMVPCSTTTNFSPPHTFSQAIYNTAAGYSPSSPLGPNWNVTLDGQTGAMTFTPLNGGASVSGAICVLVEELRDGQVIGSTMRNFAVYTEPCSQNIPDLSGVNNTNDFKIDACVGEQLCFNVHSSDPDAGDILEIEPLLAPAGLTVTTGPGAQPISQVCWTPTIDDVGVHLLVLQVSDDECPVRGRQQLTYVIRVDSVCDPCEGVTQNAAFSLSTSLLDVTFNNQSTGNSVDIIGITWGDNTGPTIRTSNFYDPILHTYASAGTYEVCLYIGTQVGGNDYCVDSVCQLVTVFESPCDSIDLLQSASFDHITNELDLIVDNTSLGSGVTFTRYQWGDGTPDGLYPGNHGAAVTHTYAIPGTYTVCVILETYVDNLCCHDTACKEITVTTPPCEGHDANFQYFATLDPCTYWFNSTTTPTTSDLTWKIGNDTVIPGNPIFYTFPGSGTYTVTLTSIYHDPFDSTRCCYDTEVKYITVNCHGKESGKTSSAAYLEVSDAVKVQAGPQFRPDQAVTISLYDITGKLLVEGSTLPTEPLELNLNAYATGIYLLGISQNELRETLKFVKY